MKKIFVLSIILIVSLINLTGCGKSDLEFTLSEDGTYYTVTGIGDYKYTKVDIPAIYNGLPVKAIGRYAFHCEYGITEVSIPSTVTVIEESAFNRCEGLTKINIPNNVP